MRVVWQPCESIFGRPRRCFPDITMRVAIAGNMTPPRMVITSWYRTLMIFSGGSESAQHNEIVGKHVRPDMRLKAGQALPVATR
jgi:hypothetical protein